MKKIFTTRYAMAAITASAVIVALTITSCTKTEELSGGKNKVTSIQASIAGDIKTEAVIGGDETDLATGTKVTLADNANSLGVGGMGVVWATGDPIYVYGPSSAAIPTKFTLTSGAASKNATFSPAGTFSAADGDQVYAIYAPWAPQETFPANWITNGHLVQLQGAYCTFKTPMTFFAISSTTKIYNYSIMYAGATYSSASGANLVFHNALAAIRVALPTTGSYRVIKAYFADGSMYNTATMTLSGSGNNPVISWSNFQKYGTRSLMSQTGDSNFSDSGVGNKMFFMMLPKDSRTGLIITFLPGGAGASATAVYYVMITGTGSLAGGNYYKIPESSVKTGALLNSSTAPSSDFWYCTADPTTSYIQEALNSASSNKTVVIDGFTSTPSAVNGCSYLETFVDNNCTALSANMFFGCTSLKNVSIPNVAALPSDAFAGCTALTEIFLPAVKSLGSRAFRNCSALKKIVFRSIVNSESWSTGGVDAFNSIDPANNIDLVLKSGQTGVGVDGKTFNGITFKNIYYKD